MKRRKVEADRVVLTVTSMSDQVLTAAVPAGLEVAGRTVFGDYPIPLEKAAAIRFGVNGR